jgi:hypothetical protein
MLQRRLLRFAVAAVTLAVLLLPTDAQAWGPLAHLDFSANALSNLGAVQPAVRLLLQEFAHDFLYGSLAADIVIGKNFAPPLYHCHGWRVGFKVLRHARPGGERAFALGFLAHLAADTVAHNYFVPAQSVASFHKARTGHAYWELRYDQRMDGDLSRIARLVSTRELRDHDGLLRRTLRRSSVLPFDVTRGLFQSILASARHGPFQHLSRLALAPERSLPLEAELITETRALSVEAILGVLRDGEKAAAVHADATGRRSLQLAAELRKRLRARTRDGRISSADARAIVAEARETFRLGIGRKLVLPASLAKLAA